MLFCIGWTLPDLSSHQASVLPGPGPVRSFSWTETVLHSGVPARPTCRKHRRLSLPGFAHGFLQSCGLSGTRVAFFHGS